MDLLKKGSETAKNGFKNEEEICDKFNNWQNDIEAKQWLEIMNYKIEEIEFVRAVILHGFKADVNVQIQIKMKKALDVQNIQVKLVSNKSGFNQVDKRWLKNYREMWNIPDDVYKILQYFTGEILPYKENIRDNRRMFFDEMSSEERQKVLNWFRENKMLIISDIIKGRGQYSAEWVLVVQKLNNVKWVLKNINEVLQYYSSKDVEFSPKGSLNIGYIGMQRKGGDGGRDTAKMLQFKLDPILLFKKSNVNLENN